MVYTQMADPKVKILASNTTALFALQLANYILPFLIIPFLTRTLGVSLYGVVALGLALVQISCILTDFGFSLSATRQIAIQSHDKIAIRKISGAVHICKALLLIPVVLIVFLFNLCLPEYNEYQDFFWLLLLPIMGQTFQPIWLFQGIQKMAIITVFMLIARSLYVIFTLLWVSSAADYFWVAIASGAAQIAAAVVAVFFMLRLGYAPLWPSWQFTKKIFLDSLEFFWSRAAVATYTVGGAFYLGLVSGPVSVALYSAAEQLYRGAQALYQPLTQSLYPYMTKNRDLTLFYRIMSGVLLLSIIGVSIGFMIGRDILVFIFGNQFSESYPILIGFMFTFLVTAPSILLGYPLLGALGDTKSANYSVFLGGGVQVVILVVLYLLEVQDGVFVVGAVLIAELCVLLFRIAKARKILS